MGDRPQQGPPHARRDVPTKVVVISVLGVALLAGVTAWLLMRPQPVVPIVDTTPTPIVAPTSTVETTPSTVVTSAPATEPVPATVREPALITRVTGSSSKGYRITVDYIQILTGKAAADAATAAGEESPPPNDYFIANTSTKLRTFSLSKTASITVLGWAGADATAKKKISVDRFMDVMPGGADPQDDWKSGRYYVTIKDGKTVTRIEQIFFP